MTREEFIDKLEESAFQEGQYEAYQSENNWRMAKDARRVQKDLQEQIIYEYDRLAAENNLMREVMMKEKKDR